MPILSVQLKTKLLLNKDLNLIIGFGLGKLIFKLPYLVVIPHSHLYEHVIDK